MTIGTEMQYVRGWPHPALAGCVLRYGGYREHSPVSIRRRQTPTGSCTLILGFGGPLRLHGPPRRQGGAAATCSPDSGTRSGSPPSPRRGCCAFAGQPTYWRRTTRGRGLPAGRCIADVAAECGYADHAHLVREFRALAGCTPSKYVAEWGS